MRNEVLAFVAAGLVSIATSAIGSDGLDKFRVACNSKQLSDLKDAVNRAKELSKAARETLIY